MTGPVPAPVLDFFIRYLSRPDEIALHDFCYTLLGLEHARAHQTLVLNPPDFDLSDAYRSDIERARRILDRAFGKVWHEQDWIALACCWLPLVGHRIAIERGLVDMDGRPALHMVASARLVLPLKQTKGWSSEELFRHYTETRLRNEWDYPGIGFRDEAALKALGVWPYGEA